LITSDRCTCRIASPFRRKLPATACDDAIEAAYDFTGGDIDVVMRGLPRRISGGIAAKTTLASLGGARFSLSVDTGGYTPGNVDFWSISYPEELRDRLCLPVDMERERIAPSA